MKLATAVLSLFICTSVFAETPAKVEKTSDEVVLSTKKTTTKTATTYTRSKTIDIDPPEDFTSKESAIKKPAKATSAYEIKIDLSLDGQSVSAQPIQVKPGKTATVEMVRPDGEKSFVEVIAKDQTSKGKDGILLNLVIGTIDKDGEKTVIGEPRVWTEDNSPVEINQRSEKNELTLTVLATRK